MFIDTHCHLTDDKLNGRTDGVIKDYLAAGVSLALDVGCNAESSYLAAKNADKYESVFFAAGVHPSDSDGFDEKVLKEIEKLLSHPKCVAVGEIGLDHYWKPFDAKVQRDCFIAQTELAARHKLPVSFHVREAIGEATEIIKSFRGRLAGGVMHCYSGSKETAKELLDEGLYFSFGGTSTYKNAANIREVIAYLPTDRILTETDSPYLSPEGKRGTVNEPKNIPIIAENIAKIKGISVEDFAEAVNKNARELFFKIKDFETARK